LGHANRTSQSQSKSICRPRKGSKEKGRSGQKQLFGGKKHQWDGGGELEGVTQDHLLTSEDSRQKTQNKRAQQCGRTSEEEVDYAPNRTFVNSHKELK
jgi:hypothetical protein